MKLTKEQLRHIIKEELTNLNEIYEEQMPEPPTNMAQPQQGEKQKADVSLILKNINKINTIQEYSQLLSAIIKQAKNVPRGKHALKLAYKSLPSIIKDVDR